MSGRSEEAQQDHQRPKPVRFSIFGQIQQQAAAAASLAVHQRGALHHLSADDYHEDRYEDDDEEEEELVGADQPLDFSAKKSEPQITAKVMAVGGHHHYQAWGHHLPSHSSESGVSDLCSNSPQSDGEPSVPNTSGSPTTVQQQTVKAPAPMSPLPATLNAIYGPLAALQQNGRQQGNNQAMDPTLSAATSQLLSNLAAVTNGGKGGKNTRPFKAYPRDPMSLPLGLYGLPMAGNAGEETVMTQASNDAYAEFRRQMLSQVNATKSKRKTSISNGGNSSINGNSRPNSVTGDEDMDMTGPNDNDMPEATHIRGTVSVTDMRLVSGNEDDSEHSGNDSIHHAPMKSPPNGSLHIAHHQHYADLSGLGSSSSMMLAATTSNGSAGSAGSSSKKRGRNGEEIKDDAYWERRRKNNEAAKRSRDARRAKEDEIAIRAAFLEQENLKLRFELANLKNETAKLRCMIYNS